MLQILSANIRYIAFALLLLGVIGRICWRKYNFRKKVFTGIQIISLILLFLPYLLHLATPVQVGSPDPVRKTNTVTKEEQNSPSSETKVTSETTPSSETPSETTYLLSEHLVAPLSPTDTSDTQEGSAKYGAILKLGDLDALGRSTYAHIRLSNDMEPGSHGEKRNERIHVDPAGWRNYKLRGVWVNNRCHLIGYQFSGLNDELRNLATGTKYLNTGSEGNGMDESNPEGMLYYEQKLDQWLLEHPNHTLDYYVKPVYEADNLTPSWYYLQWVGFDEAGREIPIPLGGQEQRTSENTYGVLLANYSPSYQIDYTSGRVW